MQKQEEKQCSSIYIYISLPAGFSTTSAPAKNRRSVVTTVQPQWPNERCALPSPCEGNESCELSQLDDFDGKKHNRKGGAEIRQNDVFLLTFILNMSLSVCLFCFQLCVFKLL